MPNQQSGSNQNTKSQSSPQTGSQNKAPMTAGKAGGMDESHDSHLPTGEGGNQLDQFVTYMKANWKTILTELVAAGVSSYLAHGIKDKASKN
jgi:hypothetical protein